MAYYATKWNSPYHFRPLALYLTTMFVSLNIEARLQMTCVKTKNNSFGFQTFPTSKDEETVTDTFVRAIWVQPEFTHLCSLSDKPEAHHDQVKTDVDSRFGGSYTDMDHAVVAKEGSNGLIITIVHCCWLTIRRLQEGAVEFFAVQSITKEENIFDLPLLHYFPLKLWRCHAFRIFNLSTFPTNMWLSCDYAQVAHE